MITSLTNSAGLSALSSITANSISSCGSQQTSSTSSTPDSGQLSGPGQLMAALKKLSESNPTEFKKITAEIASQLQSAASNSSNTNESSFLTEMANNFSKASQSGDFSDLFPQQSTSGPAQSSSSSSSQASYGPPPPPPSGSDGNDGTISQIFSNALSQIQSDLSGTSTSSSTTTAQS